VKRPGEVATPEQQQFLQVVRQGGGIAAVVYGFEEACQVLRRMAEVERDEDV
jgi:ribosomal protein L25 (general stress protein Ctc)